MITMRLNEKKSFNTSKTVSKNLDFVHFLDPYSRERQNTA
jgi:hypothetical protein